ncbi:MAG: DUF3616 domain-containing protein [Magnetococcales bacterium]|nr:DUF3616 domain-containing protein [Magnetococcales bacterium]
MKKILSTGCGLWMLLGLLGDAQAGAWKLSCPDNVKKLPRLVADQGEIEPSGVAWDSVSGMAVAVSDEASPHSLFVFNPSSVVDGKDGKTIRAFPLLTAPLVDTYRPKDLEGIARLPNGEFVASASHSLNNKKARDTVLQFRLAKGTTPQQPWVAESIRKIPPGEGFQSWLTQSAAPPWKKKVNTEEGEDGINVEGLAAQSDQLYFGFRGPVTDGRMSVLATRLDPQGRPSVVKWHALKLEKDFDIDKKESAGIRDMTAIPGSKNSEFLMLVGATGSGSDLPYQLGWWQESRDEVTWVGKIPKGFRAEGVTVLSKPDEPMRVLMVSDKMGMVMECQIAKK